MKLEGGGELGQSAFPVGFFPMNAISLQCPTEGEPLVLTLTYLTLHA